MAIPGLTLTIRDPGLSLTEAGNLVPLLAGVAADGDTDRLYPISSPGQAVDTFGDGPLPELACRVLSEAGGPVLCGRITGSVAAVIGSVAVARKSTSTGTVALTGTPVDSSRGVILTITQTGTLGTGKFTYSLDEGVTQSDPITIPGGGSYTIPRFGVIATFTAGGGPVFFEAGDTFTAAAKAPHFNTTNLSTFIDVVTASNRAWRFLSLAGKPADATAGAVLAAAMATHMTTLATAKRYRFAIMDSGGVGDADSGEDDADATVTALAAVESTRLGIGFGEATRTTVKPYPGWGAPTQPAHYEVTARLAAGLISTHAGRVASGPLPGVLAITHDERVTEGMRAAGFMTLRTWDLLGGFYPTDGRIKAPAGSDFQQAHLRMIMDVACETTVAALTTQANKSVRVLTDGSGHIHPLDAAAWREVALRKLRITLLQPLNAEGTHGHVSGLEVTVDPTWDVLSSGSVAVDVALVPLGYVERIYINVGYANAL